jgi:DNA-directed RNA polymerase subunit H (RpoH/RPB5)
MDEVSLSARFSRAMTTLYEMFVEHRKYDSISQVLTRDATEEELPTLFMVTRVEKKKKVPAALIFLLKAEKLNIDGVKEMIRLLDTHRIKYGVLVYQNSITSSAKKTLDLIGQYKIELFSLQELQYNITQHRYYCRHEKITNLSELGPLQSQTSKFPKILSTDPVVRFFAFQKNDVLRIHRHDGTIIYRLVR